MKKLKHWHSKQVITAATILIVPAFIYQQLPKKPINFPKTEYKANFIANKTPAMLADYVYDPAKYDKGRLQNVNHIYYAKSRPTEWDGVKIIYVPANSLADFYYDWLPHIKSKFILITTGDESMPSDLAKPRVSKAPFKWLYDQLYPMRSSAVDIQKLLGNPMMIKWFADNYDRSVVHNKFSDFPIGIDYIRGENGDNPYLTGNKTYHKSIAEQDEELNGVLRTLKPTEDRLARVYLDAHLNNTSERHTNNTIFAAIPSRATVGKALEGNPLIVQQQEKISRLEQWQRRGQYIFSISLVGNGFDCYRTWESLILGNIVLLQSSPIDDLFKDMPVVIIKDWNDITEENLAKWAKKYQGAFSNPKYRERIRAQYWENVVNKAKELK